MTDEEIPEVSSTEFLTDVAVRLIADDLRAGNEWRIAYTLGYVLDSLSGVTMDDQMPESVREYAQETILEITNVLLYAHLHEQPSEDEIESAAQQFNDMMDRAEDLRKNPPKTEED